MYPSIMYQFSLSPENLSVDGEIVANLDDEEIPITYRFKKEHGVLDSVIRRIFLQRLEYKKLQNEAKDIKDTINDKRYERLQYACKIAINTAYGLSTYNKSPLFCIAVGASITGLGRQIIKKTMSICSDLELKVVAVDTDAVNVVLPSSVKDYDAV